LYQNLIQFILFILSKILFAFFAPFFGQLLCSKV